MIDLFARRSKFLANTLKLVIGAGIGQAITLIISPILTRLYTPSEFGIFTFFISIVGGLALVSTLRYEMAIILQKDEKNAINMASLSLFISFCICCFLLLLVTTGTLFLPDVVGHGVMKQWLFLLPFLVLLIGTGNIFQNWFNRKRNYSILAVGKVINSAGNNGGMLILGLVGAGVWGLLGGYMIGYFLFALFFLIVFAYSGRASLKDINFSFFSSLAKRHRDLPLSNTPQVIVELMQNYGIVYLAQIFFTSSVIGWFSLSMRVLQSPLMLIGSSLSQVLYKDASELYRSAGQIRGLVLKTVKLSSLIALPMLIVLLTVGPWLFTFIFGERWGESGIYARILAPWMFFDFIRYSIAQIPLILHKTRKMFYISIAGNLFMVISMCLGGLVFQDILIGFTILSVLMSVYSIGVVLWIIAICNKPAPDCHAGGPVNN